MRLAVYTNASLVNSVYNYVTIMIYTYNDFFFYKRFIRFLALASGIVRLLNFFVPLCLHCLQLLIYEYPAREPESHYLWPCFMRRYPVCMII